MRRFVLFDITLTLLLLSSGDSEAARILALFPFPGKSHFISFSNLLEELSKRGHEVTVISAFPRNTPLKNYIDLPYENYIQKNFDRRNAFERIDTHPIFLLLFKTQMMYEPCENFLQFPVIQELMKSNKTFDLIIYEPFLLECTYGILNKFKAPTIHICSNTITKWMGDGVGNPYIYSYMPESILGYSHYMSFWERLMNTVGQSLWDINRKFVTMPKMEEIAKRVLNDPTMPSLREIETNASFLLLNSHVSLNYPRPLTPNTAEVGGMHIKPPQKLPEDLQKLLDNAKDGVIYFSLGSHLRGSDMPADKRDAFINAFAKVKQTVLWKWNMDTLPNKPKNVHIGKWFPQNEILAHPNVKLFITHGGLLSTQEATYFGMPLLAVPVMADQKRNARKASEQGFAIDLDITTLTEDTVSDAMNKVLTNTRYKEKAKELSSIFRDQLQSPLERAVFWTEFVIRHKGATHMRSASLNLNDFQYLLLDVIVVVIIFTVFSLTVFFMIIKMILCKLFSSSKSKNVDKTN